MILLYVVACLTSFLMTFLMTPVVRLAALRWGILDHPHTEIKTHKEPVPYLGGLAIFMGFAGALVLLRFATNFPTGTLRSLWGLLLGGAFLAGVGLVDDLKKPQGLSFQAKFFFQFLAAAILVYFDMRIRFVQPDWLAIILTLIWVTGISNAINLIDIMDGLASSQTLVAALGFLLISIPTEQIYVNFAAAAIVGATLAFIPHNMSKKRKIFMGDMGSLMLGFLLAGLSLGTDYTRVSEVGIFAPLLILGLPVYDTFFVSLLRLKQGKSPFLGSKDHLALKLRAIGFSTEKVVLIFAAVAAVFSAGAYLLTMTPFYVSLFLVAIVLLCGLYVMVKLHDVVVH
ncbi:MAG: undecaprenyl/decaprenyl-phosphate alpha-N-acetylglucosaminyl 1-phosphate transferase [Elusimicrobia bacterium]|nr:undecaprenyl/decaprenyl-phosphate alpha-N-acetylglucosaminyl 1-phosphate transferase [Elusimicrobiota bacterium]